ncbi:hypothetical protein HMPREF9444_01601 [Succinatimonas hippei YIT 12066]|uniref:Uncharacterized protein n=1 Tax=Succinatimonas hippei (strain DSM 22608 / JCM 16073 / KCTC 15190 / YIT 12066) TaxID=762983 RepID=E8LLG9_SUCHY|nr:hypothetical protein HMPREF9444_01601 [Succinatimonas hippei YIT 12066]
MGYRILPITANHLFVKRLNGLYLIPQKCLNSAKVVLFVISLKQLPQAK